jgi:hypothetical protein
MELVIHGDFDMSFKGFFLNQQITLLFQSYNLFMSTNFPTRTGEVSGVLASVALH